MGENPPYMPVFAITHHTREPLEMQGGTTFHFVTDGIELEQIRTIEAPGVTHITCRIKRSG